MTAWTTEERGVDMRVLTCGCLCVLVFLGWLLVMVEAGLQIEGNVCGQKKCKTKEYCSNHDMMCRPCDEVCEITSNNYQQKTCEDQCQVYIYDHRYVMRENQVGGEDLRSEMTHLKVMVILTFVVSMLVLLILASSLVLLFWHRKKRNTRPSLHLQSNGTKNGKADALKLDMSVVVPPPSTNTAPPPVTPATTSTPLSSRPRYPKEDPTLEYGAYDNPGLAPSPVFEDNQPETTPVSRRQESSF